MHPILVRVLKSGIPVAVILAVFGYLMAEAAGMWLGGQGDSAVRVTVGPTADGSPDAGGEDVTRALRRRLPFTLAAWGFALAAMFELVAGLVRRNRAPAAPKPVPPEAEAEKLLNQLLQQADAAEAARKAATSPAASCPAPSPADNITSPAGQK
jgi:hypothetical protein